MSWSAFFCLIQFLKNKQWLELKRAALESFNGTFKVLTFLVTNIWNWPLMPAMGIDVLERDSTTQMWARRGGGGVVPQVIKKKGRDG